MLMYQKWKVWKSERPSKFSHDNSHELRRPFTLRFQGRLFSVIFGPSTLSELFQLKRLLGLTRCSMEYKKTKDETLFCDPWDKRTSEDRMIMIMIGLSLILQVFYGL